MLRWRLPYLSLDDQLLFLDGAGSAWLFELGHSGEGLGGRDRGVPPQLGGIDSSHRERVAAVGLSSCIVTPLLPDPTMALLQIERHAWLRVVGIRWQAQ